MSYVTTTSHVTYGPIHGNRDKTHITNRLRKAYHHKPRYKWRLTAVELRRNWFEWWCKPMFYIKMICLKLNIEPQVVFYFDFITFSIQNWPNSTKYENNFGVITWRKLIFGMKLTLKIVKKSRKCQNWLTFGGQLKSKSSKRGNIRFHRGLPWLTKASPFWAAVNKKISRYVITDRSLISIDLDNNVIANHVMISVGQKVGSVGNQWDEIRF